MTMQADLETCDGAGRYPAPNPDGTYTARACPGCSACDPRREIAVAPKPTADLRALLREATRPVVEGEYAREQASMQAREALWRALPALLDELDAARTAPTPSRVTPPHCGSCTCGKRAPVQGDGNLDTHRKGTLRMGARGYGPGTVTWEEHTLAWSAYAQRYGREQSAEVIASRGGFSYAELAEYLGHAPTTWVPR